jgi:hypothetical protein
MADQHDRDVAVPPPELLYRPVHVGQWVSGVFVPSPVTEPQPPHGDPGRGTRRGEARSNGHHAEHRDLAGRTWRDALLLAAVQDERDRTGRHQFALADERGLDVSPCLSRSVGCELHARIPSSEGLAFDNAGLCPANGSGLEQPGMMPG